MALAGETLSDARVASEGPRATGGENPCGIIETRRSLLQRETEAFKVSQNHFDNDEWRIT